MRYMLIMSICFACFCLAWPARGGGSAFRFNDPGISDNETAVYHAAADGSAEVVRETILMRSEGGRNIYEISSSSPSLDLTLRLERETMAVVSVRTVRSFPEATFDSTFTVLREAQNDKPDEIKVPHFIALRYLFRGYPFEKANKIRINYYAESQRRQFPMSVKYKGRESVRVMDRSIECHVLEFGLDGFWATFLDRQRLWYSVEPPHYLVRYQGPESFPGSPERVMELTEYRP